ncbi:MAG: NAD(P)/FAD-dependent oxidoreductase [Bacteroidia bacterium]|jgi:NADH dehydrogenase|nr:NAD(P)/FAD-dependent oxidoreductase [Bacteroidia bacterium]MCC6767696.1 NAD(P)/FAD-dependent oxidoreductase [Bacteroidia bacterium]
MKKKLLIIGGGFAGLQLAKKIDKGNFEVVLIDRLNHHQFQPLFYQVATSQIEPSSISFPLRHIFNRTRDVQIRMADVLNISPEGGFAETTVGRFEYDYLVIATGCKTNFFKNEEIERNAFALKTTYDAIAIRNHILKVFEKAISATESQKQHLLNLIIVGAGPTGVELAGAFAEIKKEILPKDYPGIDFSRFTIYLVEGGKGTLNNMSELAQRTSQKVLEKMGVKVITETFVKNYNGYTAELSNGQKVQSATVIWAAGVMGNKISGFDNTLWVANNRIKVNRYNQVEGYENIFALGDIAYMETERYPKAHPQVANVAINQARLLAKNLKGILAGKKLQEYEYKDYGTMATIGRNKAVVDLPFIRFAGYPAWVVWMFLHLMLILSVRNKLIIFINWAWSYLTKDSSLRLILTPARAADKISDG